MRELILTKGYKALVDDEDFLLLSKVSWYASEKENTTYARGMYKDKHVFMHRVILGIANIPFDNTNAVDHINGNGLDNQKENLQLLSNSKNIHKSKLYNTNSTGIRGICFDSSRNRYLVNICVNGIKHHPYSGRDFFEACCARKSAENKLLGGKAEPQK